MMSVSDLQFLIDACLDEFLRVEFAWLVDSLGLLLFKLEFLWHEEWHLDSVLTLVFFVL